MLFVRRKLICTQDLDSDHQMIFRELASENETAHWQWASSVIAELRLMIWGPIIALDDVNDRLTDQPTIDKRVNGIGNTREEVTEAC
jgi:hypothetical protein